MLKLNTLIANIGHILGKGVTVKPSERFSEPYLNPITPKSSGDILHKHQVLRINIINAFSKSDHARFSLSENTFSLILKGLFQRPLLHILDNMHMIVSVKP